MPTREEVQALAKRLHAFTGQAEIMRKAAARDLASRHPFDANEVIHQLLALSREGWQPASCALSALVAALGMEAASIPHAESLRRVANVQSLDDVAALFIEGPPARELDPRAAAKADARASSLPLGHLKERARLTRNPDELARLALISNPAVVRNALLNPRLTEDLVVRIAARRPARPEPLVEIWKSTRWSSRLAVRRALAFNPYTPPDVAAKVIPLLGEKDWAELRHASDVHPALREQAVRLLEVRAEVRPQRL